MFKFFNKKTSSPTVTAEDKNWIEENFIWFIEAFGLDRLRQQPFILPDNFPYTDLTNTDQFQRLFEQLCKCWDVNPGEIIVDFFDDIKSKQWTAWVPQGRIDEAGGLYNRIYTTEEKRFKIQLAKSNLTNPQLLVSVMAHELGHVKLLGGNYVNRNDRDMEPLTDLACIYFGFGIFVANSVQTQDGYWISRTGYLPDQVISYANALLCYIAGCKAEDYLGYLNANTKELFRKDYGFLVNTNDTTLTKEKVREGELMYGLDKQISEGFEKKAFEEVIVASKKLLEMNPKSSAVYNNIGYAFLLQKKYRDAIEQFTRAIELSPYRAYPYNNRRYCKLQLGDLENAFYDLQHSFEMDPDNSFSWRNLGAYYLQVNELEKALEHLEQAEKIDPKTELINFYLGQAHLKLGNVDKSKHYLERSVDLKEYNDSMIPG